MSIKKLLPVLCMLLSACNPLLSGQPAEKNTVTRVISSEPPSLDPQGTAGSAQNVILPYIFDTLVYRDVDNTYKPYLAEKWKEQDDGKILTFTLREGVSFHDGTPLNADAVCFTFQRLIDQGQKSPLASSFSAIEKLEATDQRTVKITFKQASATFIGGISMPYAGIISPKAIQEDAAGFGQKPIGSGPYKLEKWASGVSITLVRNPNYHWPPAVVKNQGAPVIERLEFKIIADANSQLAAFKGGEADILFINQPVQIEKFRNDREVSLVEAPLNSLIYLGFNCKKPPFDDPLIRQALSHAINKEEIINTALGGVGEVAFAPLSPSLPGFDASLENVAYDYDLDKAADLLEEAGFTSQQGKSWTRGKAGMPDYMALKPALLISTRSPNEALATVIQNQFKKLGIEVAIRQLESSAALDTATKGDYDMMLSRYDWNDADVLNVYLSSERIGRTNRNFYSNPQVDTLLDEANSEMNAEKRKQRYLEAQTIILKEAPWQPIYIPEDYIVIRTTIEGIVIGPMGRLLLNDASIKP